MKTFTFACITYNHEKYIIEHLESIKYQIEKYGSRIKCNIVISDDCSKDRTILFVKKWLNTNSDLFEKVTIIESEKNEGIVKNYVRCIKRIDTNDFKLLAGDDIYSFNNIFALYDSKDNFIITPSRTFDDEEVNESDLGFLHPFINLLNKRELKRVIKKELSFDTPWIAPAVFYKKELFNEYTFCTLGKYKWIEDKPLFYCFFNNHKVKPRIVSKTYILYRTDSGISSKKAKRINYEYLSEEKRVLKKYLWKRTILPKGINPWMYLKLFKRIKYIFLSHLKDNNISNFLMDYSNETNRCNEYYKLLLSRKSHFINNDN